MTLGHLPGAFVISLDFELAWGVRDRLRPHDPYIRNLIGARTAVHRMLQVFEEFEIGATWAIVGFLFARSRHELWRSSPEQRPGYVDFSLSPYEEKIGEDERDDPLHFAPSLIDRIRATPDQEIATHTFSHFYCLERGQSKEAFRADLQAARAIAARHGIVLRSIVFPRNQHNPAYDEVLLENGITAYRGNSHSWPWRFDDGNQSRTLSSRMVRLLDAYLNVTGRGTTRWSMVLQPSGLSDVRASFPLRPFRPCLKLLDPARFARIRTSIRHAARNHEIFHLWWHPHNFGHGIQQNMDFLRRVLEEVNRCRRTEGMLSLTMAQVDRFVRSEADLAPPVTDPGRVAIS